MQAKNIELTNDKIIENYTEGGGLLVSLCDPLFFVKENGAFTADFLKYKNLENKGSLSSKRSYGSASIIRYGTPCKMFLSHNKDNFIGVIFNTKNIEILAASDQDAWLDNNNLFCHVAPRKLTENQIKTLLKIKNNSDLILEFNNLTQQNGAKIVYTSAQHKDNTSFIRAYLQQKVDRVILGKEKYSIGMEHYKNNNVNTMFSQNRLLKVGNNTEENNEATKRNIICQIHKKDDIEQSQQSSYANKYRYPEISVVKKSEFVKDTDLIDGIFLRLDNTPQFKNSLSDILEKEFAKLYIIKKYQPQYNFYSYSVDKPGEMIKNVTQEVDRFILNKLSNITFAEKESIKKAEKIYELEAFGSPKL